jgi:uncharacterized membrane protein
MRQLRNIFVTGCLVLAPLLFTIQILLWFVHTVDNNIRNFIPTFLLPFDFNGLGLLLALGLIFVVGFLTQNYIGKWIVNLLDIGIKKISIVGGIYSSIKKFLETVFHPKSDQFKGTVLVQFPRNGVYSIGFRTGTPDKKLTSHESKKLTNVFVPCTPNPTSGFYLLVPEDELVPLDLTVQEAFKIVISMGIVTSHE